MTRNKVKATPKDKELEVLRLISSTVNSSLEIREVLKKIVELVIEVTRGDSCLIYLYEPQDRELVLYASKNPHPKMIGEVKLKMGEGITGWVASSKKPVVIEKEAGKDPRFKFIPGLPEEKYQAFISYPILFRKELVGVINVQYKKPRKYSPTTLALMETISHQVGGAITNARLHKSVKRKAEIIETLQEVSQAVASKNYLEELLSLIVVMAARTLKAQICSILLLDEKGKKLVLKATQSTNPEYRFKPPVKVENSVSGKPIKTQQPIIIKNLSKEKDFRFPEIARKEGLKSLLSVPMLSQGRAIGTLNIYFGEQRDFSEEEMGIVQAIANQAALAIEKTQLIEEAQKAKEALEIRKAIDKAKAFLMKNLGITEEEAHKLIYKKSMDLRKPVKEVAEAISLVLPEVAKIKKE